MSNYNDTFSISSFGIDSRNDNLSSSPFDTNVDSSPYSNRISNSFNGVNSESLSYNNNMNMNSSKYLNNNVAPRGMHLNAAIKTHLRNDILRNGFNEKNFTLSSAISEGGVFDSHMNFSHAASSRQIGNSNWELDSLSSDAHLFHNNNNYATNNSNFESSNFALLTNNEKEGIMGKDKVNANIYDNREFNTFDRFDTTIETNMYDSQIGYNNENLSSDSNKDNKTNFNEYTLHSHVDELFSHEHNSNNNINDIFNVNSSIVGYSINKISGMYNDNESDNVLTKDKISNVYEEKEQYATKIDDITIDGHNHFDNYSKEDFKDLNSKLFNMKTKRKKILLEKLNMLVHRASSVEEKSKYVKMQSLIRQSINDE